MSPYYDTATSTNLEPIHRTVTRTIKAYVEPEPLSDEWFAMKDALGKAEQIARRGVGYRVPLPRQVLPRRIEVKARSSPGTASR